MSAPGDVAGQLQCLLGRVDRRALGADLEPAAVGPPAGVELDADPDRGGAAAEHRLDLVEVGGGVDGDDRRPVGVGDRADRQLAQPRGVGGRVGEEQVLESLLGEPEGLRQGEGHHSLEAIVGGDDPLEQRPRAHALARDPDRLAPGPGQHLLRVGPHRVEVDEGERRLDLLEDRFVAPVGLVRHGPSLSAPLPVAEANLCRPGEVAEWLKALAC